MLERKQYKLGKYDIVRSRRTLDAHLRYTVMLEAGGSARLLSVPTESDCRFLEARRRCRR